MDRYDALESGASKISRRKHPDIHFGWVTSYISGHYREFKSKLITFISKSGIKGYKMNGLAPF